jgi:hypothetical protein
VPILLHQQPRQTATETAAQQTAQHLTTHVALLLVLLCGYNSQLNALIHTSTVKTADDSSSGQRQNQACNPIQLASNSHTRLSSRIVHARAPLLGTVRALCHTLFATHVHAFTRHSSTASSWHAPSAPCTQQPTSITSKQERKHCMHGADPRQPLCRSSSNRLYSQYCFSAVSLINMHSSTRSTHADISGHNKL